MVHRTHNAHGFDFSQSTWVTADPDKPRYLLPVGDTPAYPLVIPDGYPGAGSLIGDEWNPEMPGAIGLVFQNPEESTADRINWVRVPTDGTAYVIMNHVSREQAEHITEKVSEFHTDPERLTADQYLEVIAFAHGIGVEATYNTDDAYVLGDPAAGKKPAFVGVRAAYEKTGRRPFGLNTRTGDALRAVLVPGPVTLSSKNAIGGEFPDGAVLVEVQDGDVAKIQPHTFEHTYLKPNGSKITVEDLAIARRLQEAG